MRLINITYASRNLFTSARCIVVMRFIPPSNSSSSFEVSAILGIVILMTFVATLRIYGIASRNFINTSMVLTMHQCDRCTKLCRSIHRALHNGAQ